MAEIRAIDKTSIHQICSSQVILDLSIAVKELVENSLDAGATCIDIKLREDGIELIEVADNGCGVEERNLAALTMKHHTSKINQFSDLESVETFGFRGEALSSLCAVCDVTICTRHVNSGVGYRIEYDHNGIMTSKSSVARQPGTTVTLKNLFKTLPVRYKELQRNIKKEYSKLLSLLSAYCIISTSVRISCTNESRKSRRCVLSTQPGQSIEGNISSVFGSKQLQSLMEFNQSAPSSEICEEYNLKMEHALNVAVMYRINGLISDPIHGNGRSVPDRQFYFINDRPVEMSKLARMLNEVYHSYNRHQFPFVALNVTMERDKVDVNVTPDKRQVFVQNEKVLLAIVKTSLIEMYKERGGNVIMAIEQSESTTCVDNFPKKLSLEVSDAYEQIKATTARRTPTRPVLQTICEIARPPNPSPTSSLPNFARFKNPVASTPSSEKKRPDMLTIRDFIFPVAKQPKRDTCVAESEKKMCADERTIAVTAEAGSDDLKVITSKNRDQLQEEAFTKSRDNSVGSVGMSSGIGSHEFDCPPEHQHDIPIIPLQFSMNQLRNWKHANEETNQISSFRAKIEPSENSNAEKELERHLTTESFVCMKPIGQFNLGFIIARLNNDLFIIDQHAADEIYNFETLQTCTKINSWKLVMPQKLQLDPASQCVLVENMEVLRANGFDFVVKNDKEFNQETVFMTKVPMSKNWDFGSRDVDEMIFMLSDAPHVMCRPSRIRQMFASRACRKSVMIGTPLNERDMSCLIKHLSEIKSPWNCPHGRPVLRHLIDLSKIVRD